MSKFEGTELHKDVAAAAARIALETRVFENFE